MKKQLIAAAAIALGATAAVAPTAQADDMPPEPEMTLAEILLADDAASGELNVFDDDQNDFDIVTEALIATGLAAIAADETAEITVFLPTDKAFRILVEDLLGVSIKDEAELFAALLEDPVGVDTVSAVLQYHVLGFAADSTTVTGLDNGTPVDTLLNLGTEADPEYATFDVTFKGKKQIRLVDAGGPGRDPIVRAVDIHATNGVAHVIDRVLIPG